MKFKVGEQIVMVTLKKSKETKLKHDSDLDWSPDNNTHIGKIYTILEVGMYQNQP